jgi:phosphomannomutase/phosphoglucomutase
VVGRDGRLSGPELSDALIEGLRKAGRNVIDIGHGPDAGGVLRDVPSAHRQCGMSVTGSHNPPDYNGFKIVVGGETLSGEAIQDLYARIAEEPPAPRRWRRLADHLDRDIGRTTSNASPATSSWSAS